MSNGSSGVLWWLSYADTDGFRGVVLLRSSDFLSACYESRWRGLSPGGQVHGLDLPEEAASMIPPEYLGKTLSADEANALNALMEKLYPEKGN